MNFGSLLVVILIALILFFLLKKDCEKRKENKEIEERRKIWMEDYKEKKAKEKQEWQNFLAEREKTFGKLTREISIDLLKKNDIFIYGESKVLFIKNKQYNFTDILSCRNEHRVIGGEEISRITTPDRGEMALEKILWGMDKSYNVKSETKIIRTPKKVENIVYIGMKSLENPQIVLNIKSAERANEICALMNVIIDSNNAEKA